MKQQKGFNVYNMIQTKQSPIQQHTTILQRRWMIRGVLLTLVVLLSVLYGFPHLLELHKHNWDITNTLFMTALGPWDSEHYSAQIKEIDEGNYLLSTTYIAEYKNTKLSSWPLLPFYLTAFSGKLLHLDVYQLVVLMDFILPPLIFLLTYSVLVTVTVQRRLSVFGAFIFVVLPYIFQFDLFPGYVSQLIHSGFTSPILTTAHNGRLCFSRTINPQLTVNFLLASVLFFVKGISNPKKRNIFLASFFGMITTYSYVYFSTYLYVFLGISGLAAVLLKAWEYARKTFFILGMTLIGSIPFWYSLFHNSDSELSQMSLMRRAHTPVFMSPQIICTILICLGIAWGLAKKRIRIIPGILSLAFLSSGVLCLNQHVITGIYVQPGHYLLYLIPQLTILAVIILISEMKHRWAWQNIRIDTILLYGGIGTGIIGILLHPSLLPSYLSSDGILTSGTVRLFTVLHLGGLVVAFVGIAAGIAVKKGMMKRFHVSSSGKNLQFLKRYDSFRHTSNIKILGYALVILLVSYDVLRVQHEVYEKETTPCWGFVQQIAPAIQWLKKNTPPESVILCDPNPDSTSSAITVYTENNVYVSEHSHFYTVPSLSELQDRLYNVLNFAGIRSQKEFDMFMTNIQLFGPKTRLFEAFERYQNKLHKDLYTALTTYQIDYVFYGPQERKRFPVDPGKTYPFLTKLYDDGIASIYQIQ